MASRYGNSVAEASEELAAQWHPRNTRTAHQVTPGSTQKVWWLGPCGHEWEAAVDNRVYGKTGCPFCAIHGGKKLRPGFNDLGTKHPELSAQWHPTKNGDLTPADTLPAVKIRVWWLCPDCGREWKALLNMRTSRGTGCPSCRGRKRGLSVTGSQHWAHLYTEWGAENNLTLNDYSVTSQVRAHWTCEKGHDWRASIGDRNLKHTGCKQCGFGGSSETEIELRVWVENLGIVVRSHHRQIDPRYEFDITVPDRKIAVEFNGIYWHQEQFKGPRYHADKTRAAKEAGWSVFHVWEDDWRDRRDVVERMLATKLGRSNDRKINARSLEPRPVPAPESRTFLEVNHVQGAAQGSVRLGLYEGDSLQALAVFRSRGGGKWELSRYATASNVRGGFTRLLAMFQREYVPEQVITFSDNLMSDGGLYANNGFVRDGEIAPDYMYVVRGHREHKFNYRKARFKSDPNLKYEEGLTERQLAELNKLPRIWDAGKVRWVLHCD